MENRNHRFLDCPVCHITFSLVAVGVALISLAISLSGCGDKIFVLPTGPDTTQIQGDGNGNGNTNGNGNGDNRQNAPTPTPSPTGGLSR